MSTKSFKNTICLCFACSYATRKYKYTKRNQLPAKYHCIRIREHHTIYRSHVSCPEYKNINKIKTSIRSIPQRFRMKQQHIIPLNICMCLQTERIFYVPLLANQRHTKHSLTVTAPFGCDTHAQHTDMRAQCIRFHYN